MPTTTKAGASNQWLELEPDYVAPQRVDEVLEVTETAVEPVPVVPDPEPVPVAETPAERVETPAEPATPAPRVRHVRPAPAIIVVP